jgi:hypothetical protein
MKALVKAEEGLSCDGEVEVTALDLLQLEPLDV